MNWRLFSDLQIWLWGRKESKRWPALGAYLHSTLDPAKLILLGMPLSFELPANAGYILPLIAFKFPPVLSEKIKKHLAAWSCG